MSYKQNINFARALLFFVQFHDCDMKFPNFTRLLYGVEVNTTQKISQSFSKLKYGPFGFNP